ncbi:unnamed protein product [Moneuplotes crassus]|uniref:Uncharacterized protein n=1 Tax=Euplotes crassus TaxID=5936 RepID=A0AAD2D8S5_EUPCR|nr:unnamed protein product [Moneuplotes crassus]
MSLSFIQKDKSVHSKTSKKVTINISHIRKMVVSCNFRRLGSPTVAALRLKSGKALKKLKLLKEKNNLTAKSKLRKNHFKFNKRAIKNIHKVDLSNYKNKKAVSKRTRAKCRTLCKEEQVVDKCSLIHRKLLEKINTKMELSKYCNGRFFSPQRLQRKIMSPVNMNRALRSPKAHRFDETKYLPELSIQSI